MLNNKSKALVVTGANAPDLVEFLYGKESTVISTPKTIMMAKDAAADEAECRAAGIKCKAILIKYLAILPNYYNYIDQFCYNSALNNGPKLVFCVENALKYQQFTESHSFRQRIDLFLDITPAQ